MADMFLLRYTDFFYLFILHTICYNYDIKLRKRFDFQVQFCYLHWEPFFQF